MRDKIITPGIPSHPTENRSQKKSSQIQKQLMNRLAIKCNLLQQ